MEMTEMTEGAHFLHISYGNGGNQNSLDQVSWLEKTQLHLPCEDFLGQIPWKINQKLSSEV